MIPIDNDQITNANSLNIACVMNGFLSDDDLHKIVGYILYDLLELGLLNTKGQEIANACKKLPDDIVNEIGKSINEYIKEKQKYGHVL